LKNAQYDKNKTCANVKEYLQDFHDWELEAHRSSNYLKSPDMSAAKVTSSMKNTTEERTLAGVNAKFECDQRLDTLELLASLNRQDAYYSDLLKFRWIYGWSVKKVCEKLAAKYDIAYIAERTYDTHLKLASCEFAAICPRELRVFK